MGKKGTMIFLLYSKSQKSYHRSDLQEMIAENKRNLKTKGASCDYIVVGAAIDITNANGTFPDIKFKLGRP